MKNTIKIQIQIAVFKKREHWIAYCPALKTFGYSTIGQNEALEDFDIAINTFIDVHTSLNTLNETLLNLGWQRKDHTFDTPKFNLKTINELRGIESVEQNKKITIPYC